MSLVLALLVTGRTPVLHAQESANIASLAGVHRLKLTIENLAPELTTVVDSAAIRLQVELKLREHGIEVSPSGPPVVQGILYIKISSLHASSLRVWSLDTEIAFEQQVTVIRLPNVSPLAETWDGAGVVGIAGDDVVRNQVTEIVDETVNDFLNAWLEANPK